MNVPDSTTRPWSWLAALLVLLTMGFATRPGGTGSVRLDRRHRQRLDWRGPPRRDRDDHAAGNEGHARDRD